MNQGRSGKSLSTRRGVLVLQEPVLQGRDGQLWSASLASERNEEQAEYLVFLPQPHAEAESLERIRQLGRIASSGWVAPDSIAQDGSAGTAVIYRFQRESALTDSIRLGELGSPDAVVRFAVRLCDTVANLHAIGMCHGQICSVLVRVSPGGTPLVVDAPVGLAFDHSRSEESDWLPSGSVRDIRAVARLIDESLTQCTADAWGREASAIQSQIGRVLARGMAAGQQNGYVQICEMRDGLQDTIRPMPVPWRVPRFLAVACIILVGAGLILAGLSIGRSGLHAERLAFEQQLSELTVRDSLANSRIAELEKQAEVHRNMARSVREDLLFTENGQSLGPNTLGAWSCLEMLLWPLSEGDALALERRQEFLQDRLTAANRLVDDAYTNGNGSHLETTLAELSIAAWELQAGRFARAEAVLTRAVPKLEESLAESDPILRGARQLSALVDVRMNKNSSFQEQDLEPWVRRLVAAQIAPDPQGRSFGAKQIGEAIQNPASRERNREFTRSVLARYGTAGASVPTP